MAEDLLVDRRLEMLRVASASLAEFIDIDERGSALLAEDPPDAAGYRASVEQAFAGSGFDGLRLEKRRRLAQVAAYDLSGLINLEQVGQALSDLADACLETAMRAIDPSVGLAVIAMGKLGGRELNYVSDIDLIFLAGGDLEAATRAATELLRLLGGFSPQGAPYIIDVNLRPEGRSGALVRSVEGTLEYYRRWAQPWEFQALIKARCAAGDDSTGQVFVDETRSIVFPSNVGAERIAGIRKMKARLEEHAARPARRSGRSFEDVKLGPGGIRDIEFCVQLLQLVHGGSDPTVRNPTTLDALAALADGGYVADEDAAALEHAYRWLRTVEHRLQLRQERRAHMLPADIETRAALARVVGFRDMPASSAREQFETRHQEVLNEVRGRFEKIFYRPMIESLAQGGTVRLSLEALKERLRVLGFRDADKAARTLEGLVSGTSRSAKLLRVLTPPLLRWLSDAPMPDEGLLSFLRLGQTLGARHGALGQLRDNPPALALLARALGSGRMMGDLLTHVPDELHSIADARGVIAPKPRERLVHEAVASLEWRPAEKRLDGLRRFKRRELLRVILADLLASADVAGVGRGLSDIADACLEAALEDAGLPFAVIGMGKLGGRELNYASDIDVIFVHDGDQATAETAAETVVRAIGELTPEGQAFRIDLTLRPEGRSGALVRSIDAYLEYYARWAKPWEHLALLKARHAAGDEAVAAKVVRETRAYAWPRRIDAAALAEIRHLKARMERERVPRGIDPRRHLKMGPGAMADVEFAVQLLQYSRAHEIDELRVAGTLEAIDAASGAGVIDAVDSRRLIDAWTFVARLRNHLFLMSGRPVDVLPTKPEVLEALGLAMGLTHQPRQELEEQYLRVTRRARKVTEVLIYG